jgi:tetratricopeptide (TPR) repeat protein
MLTSEAAHDKVISAAELQPTEYILKPFTADTLNQRIQRALARRAAMLPAYQQVAQGNPACRDPHLHRRRHGPAAPRRRLRAPARRAACLAEGIRAGRVRVPPADRRAPLGWARLGWRACLFAQGRIDEAIDLLEQLVRDNPRLMAAYDLLARCFEERGEHVQAQKTLEEAVGISPHMVRRLRKLGEVALETGDVAAAEKSFKQVVTRSRYSEFRNPEDHVNLVKALVRKGDRRRPPAWSATSNARCAARPELDACMAISNALLHDAGGNQAGAVSDLRSAVTAVRAGSALSPGLKVGLTRSLLEHRMDEEASEVMLTAMNGQDGSVTAQQAMNVFVKAGRPDLADGMGKQLRAQAQILLGVADEKRNMGDVRGAVQTLLEALHGAGEPAGDDRGGRRDPPADHGDGLGSPAGGAVRRAAGAYPGAGSGASAFAGAG